MVVGGALAALVLMGAVACSSDGGDDASSDRGTLAFADAPPGSTDLGLCAAYDIDDVKALLGGDQSFKQAPPAAIGAEGDPVTGEVCAWERTEANGDSASLRIEVRDFGDDAEGLADQFEQLRKVTTDATLVDGLGTTAFAATTDEATLLQVQADPYLMTLASRAGGDLEPLELAQLRDLATVGLEQLP